MIALGSSRTFDVTEPVVEGLPTIQSLSRVAVIRLCRSLITNLFENYTDLARFIRG